MSNPTTPFGWQMPQSTDLVTDLPADFEVFGQAVATDLQYLLGGTTGQVLAKASGTDLDFDWVTDATGMTNPMTTTADVIYSSSGSTPARLGIGTPGQVLQVNSGATAPEWATPAAAGGQTLLNIGGTALSGSSVTISSIPATYKDLKIVMINRELDTAGDYAFRFNGDSGSNRYQQPIGSAKTFNSTYMLIGEYGASNDVGSYHLSYCNDYALTTTYKMLMVQVQVVVDQNNASGFNWSRNAGIYSQTGAINSITVLPTTATSFTGGTIYVYGVN